MLNGDFPYTLNMSVKQTSVVIVESQPLMRAALGVALSMEGMTVLAELSDSRDTLQAASTLTPDLILFSVNHSSPIDLDRISVLRQELPQVLLVALVTGEFRGQERAALDHGAHVVLTKSTPRSELLYAIERALDKKIYPASAQVD